jgi:hypothetical protein
MVALPVGTGKTYVSLAIAAATAPGATVAVVAPAVLLSQWRRIAAGLGIEIRLSSHEAVSRGRAPEGSGPVIIDECHRFREPSTKRYRTIAPALPGRPVVLVTATPVVNRVDDLAAQLRLAVRDEALGAVGELVVRAEGGRTGDDGMPAHREARVRIGAEPALSRALGRIDQLRCATDPAIAALIRIGLLRALGSSPAALLAALGRYRRLLDHAGRARGAGHRPSRRAILEAIDADPEQLVLWELLPAAAEATADLALSDRPRIISLCRLIRGWAARGDAKSARLGAILEDRRPTLVFTTSVATLRYLRDRLGLSGTAWISGSGAGLGGSRASRATVLAAFDPNDQSWPTAVPRPWLLLASDVAAEGLNFQRISRVIHYDLPWTAVRLAQRDGRAIRMGSSHESVEVVRFELPETLEQRIAVERAIERKAALPARLGLDAPVSTERALDWPRAEPTPGWVVLAGECPGAIAAVTAGAAGLLLARTADGPWTRIDADEALRRCQGQAVEAASIEVEPLLASLAAPIDDWLVEMTLGPNVSPRPARRAALRLAERRGAELWRARRDRDLETVGRVQRFLGRGHSAGEAQLARAIGAGSKAAFSQAARLDSSRPATATLVALVVFQERSG